jgi:hypothetical protein
MRQLEETLRLLAGQDYSIDPEELIERIEQDMSEEGVPVVARDGNSIMQTEVKLPQTAPERPSKRVWQFAAAMLAVVATIGAPLWLLGGENAEDVVSEPEAVYSWGDGDDVSAWVTVDEMMAMFETLSKRYAGLDLQDGEVEFIRVGPGVYTDQWDWNYVPVSGSGDWSVFVQGDVIVGQVRTDRRLPEGVVFQDGWGWEYILSGPNSSEAIAIGLMPPRQLSPYPDRKETYDDMYFELASMMLRELGWAD